MSEPPSSLNFQAAADKAVLGICELLGLLFGLPFGEEILYRDKPFGEIPVLHWLYLAIGIFFAGGGFMSQWVRTRTWIPEIVSASLSKAALDARYWIAALLIIFVYLTGPELYRRATEHSAPPPMPPVVIHDPPPQAAEIPRENPLANLHLGVFGIGQLKGIVLNIDFATDAEPLKIFIDYRRGGIGQPGFSSPARIYRGLFRNLRGALFPLCRGLALWLRPVSEHYGDHRVQYLRRLWFLHWISVL